jgi:HK97 family phage prohead protease
VPKTFICSDETVNAYGFRVLTAGIDVSDFRNNPIMLFNHESFSWGSDVYNGPIGRWENIRKEDGKLMADPVIDTEDPKGKILAAKVSNNFIRAASIGFRITETSEDPSMLMKGQTRATVTKCKLIEISIVDIPANKNALALFDHNGKRVELNDEKNFRMLSLGHFSEEPIQDISDMKKISLKAAWTGLLAVLRINAPEGAETVEHEFTDEQLDTLNGLAAETESLRTALSDKTAELSRLTKDNGSLSAENDRLKKELAERPGGFPADPGKPDSETPSGNPAENNSLLDENAQHNLLAKTLGITIKA